MDFSENLQSLRKKNKLSKERLAELIGISRQAVAKWESGQSYPDINKLLVLSDLFKVTIDELINFWAMNYIGRVLGEGFSGDFLKEALFLVPEEYPYRGPLMHMNGEYKYVCSINGDFNWFTGNEEIYKNNIKVYECIFQGGIIK